jgi:hypothetical protein
MPGGSFVLNSLWIRARDRGDYASPWRFLDEEDISGSQFENTFHGWTLFVDISGEDNEGEIMERLFRHRARNLRRKRRFA